MKKFTKITAIMLTFCMALAMMAGCDDSSSKKSKKDKKEKVSQEEVDEHNEITESIIADIEANETTEETEETEETTKETTEETTEETEVIEFTLPDGYASKEEYVFEKYQEKIDEINAEDPDALYCYADANEYGNDSWTSLVVLKTGASEPEEFNCKNGELVSLGTPAYADPAFDYETIKKLPVFMEVWGYEFVDKIDNGTYYGSVWGFSLDGTKMLVSLGTPIIISADEYNSIKAGDVFTVGDDEIVVSDDYDGTNLMFNDDVWFSELEDGNYVLMTSSDYILHYNDKVTIVDIAPDCDIYDNYVSLYGSSDDTYEPDSFINSCYYAAYTDDNKAGSFNYQIGDWREAYAILEPVVVENNTITSVHLGWR